MKMLGKPSVSADESYEKCTNGIANSVLKSDFDSSKSGYSEWANVYDALAASGDLYSIKPLIHKRGDDPLVFGGIRKSNLTRLYDYYMVKKQPARQIYDDIMLSADDKCPYCGGVGRPRTLDHYLPKSKFPQFSVLPTNLVPCCRDCNSESKNTSISTTAEDQVIHPYFDDLCFFIDQWIMAKVTQDDPCALVYFVNPPDHWSPVNKERAKHHFLEFDLAVRYSIQAGEELTTLIDQRKGFMKALDPHQFSSYLSSIGNTDTLFVNHWKRIMYQTLAADTWFYSEKF
ncbi:MAG: HNH endonuclease [Candidatus Thiodiazotropha sp. (ex Ctena orbiculata)]|nr:HNH endonuclease [Candidatus Thiodiazotropha taylori]MBT2996196.1 HNH endonuclease [Candidatus Thiodiazotropha taylori]MBT2999659.1 HNH endonuclease [Candidatus Thiodiazotropha taylori]MBV2106303.1 HNH endonuclease [Candidatus Thiodiazotropha taylori]MBV2110435.1 HNH endonuclease [Candidatus Thiodiazotropha taylori]